MSNVQWNVSDMENPTEELSDNELPQDPPGYVPSAPEPKGIEVDMVTEEEVEELSEEEEEADDAQILSNARLRLEQGRLYEMLMTNDIFTNMDADPQAVKNVQREVKKFAKDRMEVMLGMKASQEQSVKVVGSQFNSLEVEILKTLAAKLSGGDTKKVDGPQPPPKSKTITPISRSANKTIPAKTQTVKNAVKAKLQTEKVETKEEDLPVKKLEDMTYDEKLEYNRKRSAIYESRKISNPAAPPMTQEAINAHYLSKAGAGVSGNVSGNDKVITNALSKITQQMLKG